MTAVRASLWAWALLPTTASGMSMKPAWAIDE